MACLDELRKQQIIDQKIYDQKVMEDTMRKLAREGLQKNIVMDSDTMISKRTGEVLDPEKTSFKMIFIVFIDHKITFRRVNGPHILNGIAPWVPGVLVIFCKKSSLPSFLPCSSISSRCFFVLCLGLVPNISLQFTIFFYPLQYFVKFSGRDISILYCL